MKRLRIFGFFLACGLLVWGLSFKVPPAQSTQLFQGARIDAPTLALFERACRNCHSENTQWPWYSRIPPIYWAIRKDVNGARQRFNLSHWASYGVDERADLLTRMGSAARTGQMPLPRYTLLHREARLSAEERERIYEWCRGERKRLSAVASK